MTVRTIAAFTLMLSCLQVIAAPDMGLRVAMEIERDGQSLAKPAIWQPSGSAGEISVKDEFRLKVTPTRVEDMADLRFELFTTHDGVESAAGTPRIFAKIGQRASLAWNTSNGKNYKLSVLVSETEKPVQ